MFTVKDNQKNLKNNIMSLELTQEVPDAETFDKGHGRIESRQIWTSTSLNSYVNFPHVEQVFVIQRHVEEIKPKHCDIRLTSFFKVEEHKPAVLKGKEVLLIKKSDEHYEIGFKNSSDEYEQQALQSYQQDEAFLNAISQLKNNAFSGTLNKKRDFRECFDPIVVALGGQTHYKKSYTELVCGVTSLGASEASAKEILEYNRGHWGIENREHYVRDRLFDEDRSQVRTKNGPMLMATLRNFAISICRLLGCDNIAKATRNFSKKPHLALQAIGI